jgi:hypothetical protein
MPTETTIETLLKDIKVMAPSKEQILQQKFGINPKNLNRINNSKTLRDTFQKANAYYEHSETTQMPSHNPQY